jgi:hypothetical protein
MQVSAVTEDGLGSGGQGRYGILARQRGSRGRNGILRKIRSYRDLVARSRTTRRCGNIVTSGTLQSAPSQHPRMTRALPPELRGRAADVELLNNSEDPVTDVLVFLSRVSFKVQRWWDQEPEYRVMIGVLPPGRWTISVPKSGGAIVRVKLGGSSAVSRVMVIISFTDSAGNHWARGARSELRQLPAASIDYWKVHKEDVDWRVPTRLD